MNWAKRLTRVFDIEIDTCQRCGGTLKIIASIEQPERPLGTRAPPVQSRLR
jgi:rRNA maturation endonuclease Nob1